MTETKQSRKEAIREYKETPLSLGIFGIRNERNGKIFIGAVKDPRGKLNRYRFQLENGSHPNRELQREFTEAGAAAFSFEILDLLKPDDKRREDEGEALRVLEQLWFDKLRPYGERGYHRLPE